MANDGHWFHATGTHNIVLWTKNTFRFVKVFSRLLRQPTKKVITYSWSALNNAQFEYPNAVLGTKRVCSFIYTIFGFLFICPLKSIIFFRLGQHFEHLEKISKFVRDLEVYEFYHKGLLIIIIALLLVTCSTDHFLLAIFWKLGL